MEGIFREFRQATDILIDALARSDLEKAHEAVSVMLSMGMHYLGPDNPAFQQCFPVWDRLEKLISTEQLELARSQADTWSKQLDEVIEIVSKAGG